MTIVVSFFCQDGVVIATDSMITNSNGNIGTTETKGKKLYNLNINHLFAYAGDLALAARFRAVLEHSVMQHLQTAQHPLDYATNLTITSIKHFTSTGLNLPIDFIASVSFEHGNQHQCAIFDTNLQPRFLDADHYWMTFGSGKQYADPFLAFLTGVFCEHQPTTNEAKFLATWALDHVIETNTGGVNGPIQMSVLQRDSNTNLYSLLSVSEQEIDDQKQAIDDAKQKLVEWKNFVSGNVEDNDITPPPSIS